MYSFSSKVRYSECDGDLRLTIPGCIRYLQDCSMFHCEHVGHGLAHCERQHFAWFVIAWQIRIHDLPRYGDSIRVSTWCYEMTSTLAKRCFTIEDDRGNLLVIADSLVVAFDTKLLRAARIPESEHTFVSDDPAPDLPPTRRKLAVEGPGIEVMRVPVTRRLLDSNGHVNNVQYIALAEDAIHERDAQFSPQTILVQYRNSAHLADEMLVKLHEEQHGYGIDICGADGKTYAIVRMRG